MLKGIKLQSDGLTQRGMVMSYHCSPFAIDFSYGYREDAIEVGDKAHHAFNYHYKSKYTIGFEVEKNEFPTDTKVTNLFKGFERDGSCGVEAITNILPLLPRSLWRMKVYDMFHQAQEFIDVPCDSRCSTHMHIGIDGMNGEEIRDTISPYMGIMYALFRKRLANSFCRMDIFMDGSMAGIPTYNDHKYRVCKTNEYTAELRIPSKITSVSQLKRRYELAYEMVDCAVNRLPYSAYVRKAKPILMDMYGDADKVKQIVMLGAHFQKMIDTKTINRYVLSFMEGWDTVNECRGALHEHYGRSCRNI